MTIKSCAISIIIFSLALPGHSDTYANSNDVIIGTVVSVADGDTITILTNKSQHRIRIQKLTD